MWLQAALSGWLMAAAGATPPAAGPQQGDATGEASPVTVTTSIGMGAVVVEVRGLAPEQVVQFGAGLVDSEWELLGEARSDAAGTLRLRLPLATTLDEGSWVVVVADRAGHLLALSEPLRGSDAEARTAAAAGSSPRGHRTRL